MRLDFARIAIPRQRRELLARRGTEQSLERPSRHLRQLPDGQHADLGQSRLGDRAHAPHQLDGQVVQEIQFGVGIDDDQPVGLGHLRGDFRQVLRARHADRDRQAKLRPHAAPDRPRNVGRRTEEMGAARDVGKGLIDGNPLDEGREIAEHLDGGVAQPLVLLEMAADKSEVWTELARAPPRHAAADPEGLGFVGSGQHNPAADGDGLAAQGRVEQLLDRGIEGVQVRMEDGGRHIHPTTRGENKKRTFVATCQATRDLLESVCRSAAGWFVDLISETVPRRWRPRLASGGVLRCASCSSSNPPTRRPPTPELLEAMHKLADREIKAGRMLDNGGLMPLATGAQVRITDGQLSVVDGPFVEAKEVIGGYAIFELPGKEEALASAKEFMQLHKDFMPGWEGTCELRALSPALEARARPHGRRP